MSFLLPLLAGAALGGGGGSTSQQSTLTGTNSLQSNITPSTVISIGGAVESAPYGPSFGESTASGRAQSAIATPDNPNPLGGLGGVGGGVYPQQYAAPLASSGGGIGSLLQDNLPILLIGAAALYFVTKA